MFAGNVEGRTQTLPLVVYGEFQGGDLDASIAAAAILVLAAFGVLVAVRVFHWGRVLDSRGLERGPAGGRGEARRHLFGDRRRPHNRGPHRRPAMSDDPRSDLKGTSYELFMLLLSLLAFANLASCSSRAWRPSRARSRS